MSEFRGIIENLIKGALLPWIEEHFDDVVAAFGTEGNTTNSAYNWNNIVLDFEGCSDERINEFLDLNAFCQSRKEIIHELRNISEIMTKERRNCNLSKLAGACTGIIGGLTVGASFLIPFTGGLSAPIAAAGGIVSLLGGGTSLGTAITECALVSRRIKQAKNILEEDRKKCEWMLIRIQQSEDLQKAINDVMNLDIFKRMVKDLAAIVQETRNKFSKIQGTFYRMQSNQFMKMLMPIMFSIIEEKLGLTPELLKIRIAVFLAIFLVLVIQSDNQNLADISITTLRLSGGIGASAVFIKSVDDMSVVLKSGLRNGTILAPIRSAVIRGLAVAGLALDVINLILTSIDLHKGSISEHAKAIEHAADEMEEELRKLEKTVKMQ
ncbi:uncharacterized protein LOC118205716 [Stegodyphus dumicola]|uniref:uncharacterized protein LOC118205716 n=1 Tax=Stegodyphus dumicola TaxID=202533 RepID=UPI0015B2FCFB|nr:uncharacterized protein LOC118205716 [Stegodyphus dumicola]